MEMLTTLWEAFVAFLNVMGGIIIFAIFITAPFWVQSIGSQLAARSATYRRWFSLPHSDASPKKDRHTV